MAMKSSYMNFEFGQCHYSSSMTGKSQTILMLHAFHSSAASYEKLCDLLSDKFNVVCLDLPGHGLSAHLDCSIDAWYYSLDGFTALLQEFIQRMDLKNFIIVGDSVGGNCAVRAMASLPELKGLVLMGSAQAENVEKVFALHHQSEAIEILFQKDHAQEQAELLAACYVNPAQNNGENFKLMLQDIQRTDPNCREQFAHFMQHQEWVDELALIQNASVPLIYILGLQDGFINSAYYKERLLEAGLQNEQIHLLENVRHVPSLDNPQESTRLIVEFSGRV